MGVQKELEAAKKDLDVARIYFEKPDIAGAKRVLENVKKKIGDIVKVHEEKKKKATEGLKKLNEAVKVVDDVLGKTPFDGAKAIDAIKKATTAAAGAEQAAAAP